MWWKALHQQYMNLQFTRIQARLHEKESKRLAYMNSFWHASRDSNVNAVAKYSWPNQPGLANKQLVRHTGKHGSYYGGLRSKSTGALPEL